MTTQTRLIGKKRSCEEFNQNECSAPPNKKAKLNAPVNNYNFDDKINEWQSLEIQKNLELEKIKQKYENKLKKAKSKWNNLINDAKNSIGFLVKESKEKEHIKSILFCLICFKNTDQKVIKCGECGIISCHQCTHYCNSLIKTNPLIAKSFAYYIDDQKEFNMMYVACKSFFVYGDGTKYNISDDIVQIISIYATGKIKNCNYCSTEILMLNKCSKTNAFKRCGRNEVGCIYDNVICKDCSDKRFDGPAAVCDGCSFSFCQPCFDDFRWECPICNFEWENVCGDCQKCDGQVCECKKCYEDACRDCTAECEECYLRVCLECLKSCQKCEGQICQDCIYHLDDDPICKGCNLYA